MARPIEPTPILYGKDAKQFLKDFNNAKLTPEVLKELERCEKIYEEFYSKSNKEKIK